MCMFVCVVLGVESVPIPTRVPEVLYSSWHAEGISGEGGGFV